MAEHVVSITAYFERGRDDFLFKAPTTYAILEVQPPVDPGDEVAFRRIVLGDEWYLVDVRKMFANATAAVFLAESSLPEQAKRHEDIAEIARRLGYLANNPNAALAMMEERPFPERQQSKPEPILEAAQQPRAEEKVSVEDVPAEDGQAKGITVHLAPVDIPPLTVNVPSLGEMEEKNVKPVDLPPIEVLEPPRSEGPDQPRVFGPSAMGLTRFGPGARVLPWPPPTSDGKHARKEQNDN